PNIAGINAIVYYAPVIFIPLGHDANTALIETSMLGDVNLVFTIISVSVRNMLDRKPILYIVSAGMCIALSVVGFAAYNQVIREWLLPFLLLFMASFSISWGPVVWVLLSEIFPSNVRSLALSIAVFIQWAANFMVSQTFPVL